MSSDELDACDSSSAARRKELRSERLAVGETAEAKQPRDTRQEMTRVIVRVEADQVTVEDAEEDLSAHREHSATAVSLDWMQRTERTYRKTSELGNGVWRKNPI